VLSLGACNVGGRSEVVVVVGVVFESKAIATEL